MLTLSGVAWVNIVLIQLNCPKSNPDSLAGGLCFGRVRPEGCQVVQWLIPIAIGPPQIHLVL